MYTDANNTQVHETTGACPYELVFGQKPREVLFPSGQKHDVIFEEDLECNVVLKKIITANMKRVRWT